MITLDLSFACFASGMTVDDRRNGYTYLLTRALQISLNRRHFLIHSQDKSRIHSQREARGSVKQRAVSERAGLGVTSSA